MEQEKMKPIWYFVGLMLGAMGIVVLISGIVNYSDPQAAKTALSNLHPALWWGAIMIAAGAVFVMANRKTSVD